jgi:alpha-galactosidase
MLVAGASVPAMAWTADAQSVEVTVESHPLGAIETKVKLRTTPDGSVLEINLVNRGAAEARLERVSVRLPWTWPARSGTQMSMGASTMFDRPALVRKPDEPDLKSANYLIARSGEGVSQMVGFLTWKTFRSKLHFNDGMVTVAVEGEGRRLRPGETLMLERLWFGEDAYWHELLYRYAKETGRENGVRPRRDPRFVGWSNWDYYGSRFTARQVLDNLEALDAMKVGANLVQVDGGWWDKCGDYNPRADFPGGMKAIADAIRARGMMAGIHFDGARADADARVVRDHPEFFLKDQHGRLIGGTPRENGRRGRVYFDFSHPGARAHLRDAFCRARREWGYMYFKVDFLKFALPEYMLHAEGRLDDGTRVTPFDDRFTSVERFHLAMKAMREGMGNDAWFLGCTAEFGPVVGHIDALRSGGDIDPTYSRFSRACMENGGAFYLHGNLFVNDADYHVARGRADEDEFLVKNPRKTGGAMPFALAEMWTHYMGLFGGPKLSGDNLLILREERKALFRRAASLPACERWLPLDFWQHARDRDDPFRVFLGEAEGKVYLAVFNWAEAATTVEIKGFPAGVAEGARLLHGVVQLEERAGRIEIMLGGLHSAVLILPDGDFDSLGRSLDVF